MFKCVTDDVRRKSPSGSNFGLSRNETVARCALLASILGVLSAGASVSAQQAGRAGEFRASVVDLSAQQQRVVVPLYGSVAVETTVEVVRADVVAENIANVQVISPKRLLITGESYGTTNIVLLGADNRQFVIEASVELDLRRLNDAIKDVDPLSDADAQSILGHIVLVGTVSSAERATRIAELANLFLPASGAGRAASTVQNHLTVAGEQQVLIRVTVAEVSRSAARELGVNGFIAGESAQDAFLINQIGGINPINIGAAADFPLYNPMFSARQMLFQTGDNGIPITDATTLSLGFPKIQMQTFIRALADNSLLKILAEPNLVAISGETATFLAGGEFPIPVPQGNQQVTIEFRQFGIRLNFTPVVKGEQLIRLRVAPEVSELDFSTAVQIEGFVVPGLSSRSSETTVELGNGQTIAIAGLLSEEVRGVASRVPGIGEVPVLGALFRSVNFQRSLTELVILVTPEIVAPLDAHQRPKLPTDEIGDPSDSELYLLGLLENGDETAESGTARGPDGDVVHLARKIRTQPEELSVHGPWGHAAVSEAR